MFTTRRRPTATAPIRSLATLLVVGAFTVAGCASSSSRSGPQPAATSGSQPTATSSSSCRGTGTTAKKNVRYRPAATGVDPNLQSLDVYEPIRPDACGPAPMVVYVHGGGFVEGDKANKIDDKVKLFNDEGWVFASLNYRLSPSTPTGDANPIRYPTHEQDVAAAIAWLQQHSGTFGGDPKRILLMGHSSGAFLASLVSTDLSFLTDAGVAPGSIRCTASLDTEYDVANQVAQGGSQERLYRNAFGDDPAVWAKGSPIDHTARGADRPSFLIFTRGSATRVAQARAFGAALVAGGTPAKVLAVNPLQHEEVNAAVGKSGDTAVTPPLMAFFRSCVTATATAGG